MCGQCGRRPRWARDLCNTCYAARRRRMKAYGRWAPEVLVPAEGCVRRLRGLVAMGWRIGDLARELGLGHPRSSVARIVAGGQLQVRASTATRVGEVFERLQMTAGPSRAAAARARAKGWAPPLAWDRIDDPAATPVHVRTAATRLGFTERYAELRGSGLGDRDIAELMGIKPESLARQKQRHLREAS